ncbi:hypothetical protein [Roseiflexus castenholzii]|uniref:hypothetical protein n=1 Tax=Roseiflexus castenholzii TaxID=120962 RepID=UPI003C7BA9A3
MSNQCGCAQRLSSSSNTGSSCFQFPACFAPFIDAGCWLLHANIVQKSKSLKSLRDFVQHVFPWHCLVCCGGFSFTSQKGKLPDYVMQALGATRGVQQTARGDGAGKSSGADLPAVLVIFRDSSAGEARLENEDSRIGGKGRESAGDDGEARLENEDIWTLYQLEGGAAQAE